MKRLLAGLKTLVLWTAFSALAAALSLGLIYLGLKVQ